MPDFISIPPSQGKSVTIEERMTTKLRCFFNSQTESAKHFELLACSVPGMGRTELPAASEYLPEGGKLQGDEKIGVSFISHTLKINKWLN